MADDRNISLDIHDHQSNGPDGYTNTVASDGKVYSYMYSGGTGNGGDVSFTSRGRVTVTVKLPQGTRYQTDNVGFENDVKAFEAWTLSRSRLSWVLSTPRAPGRNNAPFRCRPTELRSTPISMSGPKREARSSHG